MTIRKEIVYIVVPIALCLSGIIFKYIFLSETLNDTQQVLSISNEQSAQFYKDSLVQNNIFKIKKLYEDNKRDKRSYGEVITDLLKSMENMLQQSGIEYKGNDIIQDLDELNDYKSGTTSFFINLNITSSYSKIRNLLQLIEQSNQIINVEYIELSRTKGTDGKNPSLSATNDDEIDEFNFNVPVSMKARLEFVKFF